MDSNNMFEQNQNTTQGDTAQFSSYYEAPVQTQVQMPYGQDLEEPVSMGEWLIAMLLMCVPCVNIIMMFVWAFGSSAKKSKSNFFKAALIWYGISFVLMIIMIVLMSAGIVAAM